MIAERPLTDGTIALLNLDAQIDALEPEVRLGRASVETASGSRRADLAARADRRPHCRLREGRGDRGTARARRAHATQRPCSHARERAPAFIGLTMLWPTSIVPSGSRSMPKRPMASGRQFSRPSAATMKPLSCARKPQSAGRALKMSRPWSACMPSGAKSRQQNGSTQQSRSRYRGVSPFPLALLDFQLGLMWMNEGRLDDARRSFEAARRRVPAYAPAQGHLAEVEAELGEIDSAISRLHVVGSVLG